ncbi:hypothetical protein P168DRAFT_312773 [Aspergillus campestris IBT 28561]|uniref:Uncharacterized protein n=1 Tax=Aspergillus campestris (strain IBT 28561) TaxID=1392248 RepID=A0A2I1CVM7_ASPC2|nr:uncharacterized protein P168DRAFT_312773 [Aspergillus campestris IBT 28561]PKY01680.1 hypothetical protein P168DRAFT_312773 [Aspergillus campestris IBT 28561]
MGGSSPPFLYGSSSAYNFYGPTDRPYNPKAVTQASWTRPQPKPKPKGPLVNFNKHPDSYSNIPNGKSRWTPMHPRTKSSVIHGRQIQLGLRILALLGALGSLFCAIVIKNVAVTMVWIVRVAPAVAILHTLYSIYHLCRSPITRPPGSQASYMLFAAILDFCLVPFYVFTAYLSYLQYTRNVYHWGTILSSDGEMTTKIAQTTFILSVANGGLHLISFGISVFLGIIFKKITQLPPDLNPLEDNLTARPHKRTKSELIEKHASQSTLDSAMSEDPLIGSPRMMAFMHTRNNSSVDMPGFGGDYQRSPGSSPNRWSPMRSRIPEMPYTSVGLHEDEHMDPLPEETHDVFTRPTSSVPRGAPVREPSPNLPNRSQCASPESANWVAFPSRSGSVQTDSQNGNQARREPSSAYSRSVTPGSTIAGAIDWISSAQRNGWNISDILREDVRGEYDSVPAKEHYGREDADSLDKAPRNKGYYDDDHAEQDIGDNHIHIFPDPEEHDDQDASDTLHINPLALNPPTPQPVLDNVDPTPDQSTPMKRMALTDIPNLAPTPPSARAPPIDSPLKNGRFYHEVEESLGFGVPRNISLELEQGQNLDRKKTSKLMKRQSQKNAYGALKQHDPEDDGPASAPIVDSDRKGRVVSNSGADLGRGIGGGAALSYGNYIAGLGVGRRRDVSGKIAEEGRSRPDPPPVEQQSPTRAAGWARFAGL